MMVTTETKPTRYAIVGMQFREKEGVPATAILKEIPPDEPCILVREPANKYDRNAVQVWVRGKHVGFIPKTQNAVLARFIDDNGALIPPGEPQARVDSAAIVPPKQVSARVHKGNNTHPLVEIA